jgi:hypothetical protein
MIKDLLGKKVFIRTVTFHYTGLLAQADEQFLRLSEAAWIADSGRFADALKMGSLSEVEPYPGDVLVAVGSIVDVTEWQHELPRTQR